MSERVWDDEYGHWVIQCETCGSNNDDGETRCGYCGERLEGAFKVYEDKNFSRTSLKTIARANEILEDYDQQGFKLTLRQLYYQFVSKALIENSDASYKRLGSVITDARLAGRISFEAIEDRDRVINSWFVQPSVSGAFKNLQFDYAEDLWSDQEYHVEVWVEKNALSGLIEVPCRQLKTPYMACRGYMSASAIYEAGMRYKAAAEEAKELVLIHLGDHDPSGVDMTRDNLKRLEMFSESVISMRRIALNMDQIEKYKPPPNPAKVTDSRAGTYIAKYGRVSWELDALSPKVLNDLIRDEIMRYIDVDKWKAKQALQEKNRAKLKLVEDHPAEVLAWAKNEFGGDW